MAQRHDPGAEALAATWVRLECDPFAVCGRCGKQGGPLRYRKEGSRSGAGAVKRPLSPPGSGLSVIHLLSAAEAGSRGGRGHSEAGAGKRPLPPPGSGLSVICLLSTAGTRGAGGEKGKRGEPAQR